jgi:hypothetical protein
VEALCQQFGLWDKLRQIPGLDCRKRKTQGYSAELMVAQLLYSLTSGGGSLADAERLNEEPLQSCWRGYRALLTKLRWANGCGHELRRA